MPWFDWCVSLGSSVDNSMVNAMSGHIWWILVQHFIYNDTLIGVIKGPFGIYDITIGGVSQGLWINYPLKNLAGLVFSVQSPTLGLCKP